MESNVASCKDLLLNYIPKMSYALQAHVSEESLKTHTFEWFIKEKANVFSQDQNNEYFYNTFHPSKWYWPTRVTGLKEYFVHSEFPALTFARLADVVIDQLTEQD
ncbi:hypothetical protein O9G_006220, partial [Rozella allomycis CSF55]